jgi:UDP-N-acetylglucosamine 2-epimerase (non-hydrolysing)
VAGAVADLHFAPTPRARENLLREGVADVAIRVTGNPAIDALQVAVALPYTPGDGPLRTIPGDKRLILVTAHRRENFGEPLTQICLALRDIALAYAGDVRIVYPVHLNPNVQGPARHILNTVPGVTLTDPLDYLSLVYLLKRATLVLTDSGGLQEEAPSLGVPVLVLRETTERPEGVVAGTARLVGSDRARIVREASRLLDNPTEHARMARAINPYGDGHAAPRIVKALLDEANRER